jgi:hypothetical protein
MGSMHVFTALVADIADGRLDLSEIGTIGLIGGIVGESMARIARSVGLEPGFDGWREGMFLAGLTAFFWWIYGQMGA